MHPVVAITTLQLAAALAFVALERFLTGGGGLMWPMLGLFGGAIGGFLLVGRRREAWPQRTDIQQISVRSAVAHWAISTAGYIAAYAAWPESFSFSVGALLGLAPVVGALPGMAALVLTMCAGDTAATILQSYEEMQPDEDIEADGEVDLYERFTVRTKSRYGTRHGKKNRTTLSGR